MTARPAGPGSWLTHSEVHVVPLAQCSEPVQAPALVVVLEELHEACKERGDEGRRHLPAGSAPAQLRAAFAQSSSWPLGGRGWEKSQEKSPMGCEHPQPVLCCRTGQHTRMLQAGPGPAGTAALTLVHGEGEELVPEHLVHEPIRPAERGLGCVGVRRCCQPCLPHS